VLINYYNYSCRDQYPTSYEAGAPEWDVCRACGALDSFSGAYPALADWANLCRTYGASKKGPAKVRGRYIDRS